MKEFLDRLKHHFAYDAKERRDILIAAVIIGFIFSFNDWGKDIFNPAEGMINWLIVSIIALISMIVHISVQKAAALKRGFKPIFRLWKGGVSAGVLIIFGSLGRLPLPLIGKISSSPMSNYRLGRYPYAEEFRHNAWIAMVGIISTLLFTAFIKLLLEASPNSYLLNKFLIINIIYAIVSSLPLPNTDGIDIFFFNAAGYMTFILFVIVYISLLYLVSFIYSIIFALAAAVMLPHISKLVYGKINKGK